MGKSRLSYYKKIVMLPLKDTKNASFHNCGVQRPQMWTLGITDVDPTVHNCETK